MNLPQEEETIHAIESALQLSESNDRATGEAVEQLGAGWIGEEALAIGLYSALKGKDFKDVIRIAANHSGDSDSTASIAGQLYGAIHGINDLPQDWLANLELFSVIKDIAARLSLLNDSTTLEAPVQLAGLSNICTCSLPPPENCPIPDAVLSCNGCLIADLQNLRHHTEAAAPDVQKAVQSLVDYLLKDSDSKKQAIVTRAVERYKRSGTEGCALPKVVLYIIYKTRQLSNGYWSPAFTVQGLKAVQGTLVQRWPDNRESKGTEWGLMFSGYQGSYDIPSLC